MRTAVVTGGSSGIGYDICQTLLANGYRVVNLSRRPASQTHENLYNYSVDLADLDATEKVASEIANAHNVSDLIHNAGVIRPSLLGSVDLDDLTMVTNIHVGSAIILAQAFLPTMREHGNGRIVLISSRAALGLETRTCYSATKSGMIGMARTWALELGGDGITVNVVAPGPIAETEMFDDAITDAGQRQSIADSIPVKRLGRPADVSRAVQFFLSPDNSFITGQTLLVCGGASLGALSL
jgi:NAD(P)-dependent dehydrogenase (short-subunit alcohol dehydrogenase family)